MNFFFHVMKTELIVDVKQRKVGSFKTYITSKYKNYNIQF